MTHSLLRTALAARPKTFTGHAVRTFLMAWSLGLTGSVLSLMACQGQCSGSLVILTHLMLTCAAGAAMMQTLGGLPALDLRCGLRQDPRQDQLTAQLLGGVTLLVVAGLGAALAVSLVPVLAVRPAPMPVAGTVFAALIVTRFVTLRH